MCVHRPTKASAGAAATRDTTSTASSTKMPWYSWSRPDEPTDDADSLRLNVGGGTGGAGGPSARGRPSGRSPRGAKTSESAARFGAAAARPCVSVELSKAARPMRFMPVLSMTWTFSASPLPGRAQSRRAVASDSMTSSMPNLAKMAHSSGTDAPRTTTRTGRSRPAARSSSASGSVATAKKPMPQWRWSTRATTAAPWP
mmetsp:Transcript_5645/g.17933  ORF Transcript_5645/g.17933 Transcript_5645/m.17933 type:complete len:200 (+) Transcript_5645:270-869(+)